MDGNGETAIFHVKIWNHPTETTIFKWLFRVPGKYPKKVSRRFDSARCGKASDFLRHWPPWFWPDKRRPFGMVGWISWAYVVLGNHFFWMIQEMLLEQHVFSVEVDTLGVYLFGRLKDPDFSFRGVEILQVSSYNQILQIQTLEESGKNKQQQYRHIIM